MSSCLCQMTRDWQMEDFCLQELPGGMHAKRSFVSTNLLLLRKVFEKGRGRCGCFRKLVSSAKKHQLLAGLDASLTPGRLVFQHSPFHHDFLPLRRYPGERIHLVLEDTGRQRRIDLDIVEGLLAPLDDHLHLVEVVFFFSVFFLHREQDGFPDTQMTLFAQTAHRTLYGLTGSTTQWSFNLQASADNKQTSEGNILVSSRPCGCALLTACPLQAVKGCTCSWARASYLTCESLGNCKLLQSPKFCNLARMIQQQEGNLAGLLLRVMLMKQLLCPADCWYMLVHAATSNR